MTAPARGTPPASPFTATMNRLLTIALVVVTVLPLVIFATDFTNSRALEGARAAVRSREAVNGREEGNRRERGESLPQDPEARRERVRQLRAERHPTLGSMAGAVLFQLVMLTAIAAVGRRLFALRL